MSRQQSDNAGAQVERPAEHVLDEQRDRASDSLEQVGGAEVRERRSGEMAENPKRVQYAQGYAKDHPSQPGTDKNLGSGPGPASRETPEKGGKRSG